MSDDFELDYILYHRSLPQIYRISYLLTTIIIIAIIIIFTFKYQTYYVTKGKMIDNQLEIIINIDDLKYLNRNVLYIDNKKYQFKVKMISKELVIDSEYNNYRYAYLEVSNLTNIDNYVYEVKIPKENKIIAKYLKDYL